jgi:multiple sugar transport system substrate-binding protein
MRKVLALVVFAALAIVAAGCGGSSTSSGNNSSSSSQFRAEPASQRSGQTLHIYGFGPGDDVANNRAALATKAVAPAKVSNPAGAFDPQRFLTQLAGGSVPDVVYLDRQQIATLAAQGALQPIDGCLTAQGIGRAQFRRPALQEATYKGKLYALPEFTNQRALIVNLDALRQAGVPLSDVSTTDWAKLKVVAKKLTKMQGGKLTRIGFDPKIPEFFILSAHANGARSWAPTGGTRISTRRRPCRRSRTRSR